MGKTSFLIILFAIFATTNFMSCNGSSKELGDMRDTIRIMQHNCLRLSLDKMACCVPDNDSARIDTAQTPYRLVVYVDSTKCSPCILSKMYQWNTLIDQTRAEGNKISYIFIFEPKNDQIEDANFSVESSGLKNRVYLDTAHIFRNDNKFLPKDSKYYSILINSRDSILLVGNPKTNEKIRDVFFHIINKHH